MKLTLDKVKEIYGKNISIMIDRKTTVKPPKERHVVPGSRARTPVKVVEAAPVPVEVPVETPDFDNMSKKKLMEYCELNNIPFGASITKTELLNLLRG